MQLAGSAQAGREFDVRLREAKEGQAPAVDARGIKDPSTSRCEGPETKQRPAFAVVVENSLVSAFSAAHWRFDRRSDRRFNGSIQ